MAKILDLWDKEKPGSVKLTRFGHELELWFQPYFISGNNLIIGLTSDGAAFPYNTEDNYWQLYVEPKKKKILYEWIVKYHYGWAIMTRLRSEEEAKVNFSSALEYKKTDRQFEVEE